MFKQAKEKGQIIYEHESYCLFPFQGKDNFGRRDRIIDKVVTGQVSKSVFIHLPFPYLVSIDKSQSIIGFLPGDWSRIRANNSAAFSSDKPSSRIHLMMKAAMPADWNS